jgi:hypothetical protein
MSLLLAQGELAHAPVAALLVEALNLGATGVLIVKHGGAESRVLLRDGVPVGAQTFAAFRPLGQVLLSAGVIDMDTLARSLGEMARSGRPQGEVLVEMKAVTRAQVDAALSEQQAGYLELVAGLAEGTYVFEARPPPEWTRGVRIAPLRAIVRALEAPQAAPLCASAIDGVRTPIALAPGYARLVGAFGWSEAEAALVGRLQSLTAVEQFFQAPGVPAERARAILAALLLLGLASGPGAAEVVQPEAVRELAALAGEPLEVAPAAAAAVAPAVAAPRAAATTPPRPPESAEARERRQRLLARAMQNLGVGPLAGRPPAAAPPAPAPAPAPPAVGQGHAPGAAAHGPGPDDALRAALAAALPRAREPDLFARLGVPRTATRAEVRDAYFKLAKRFHPDRFASPGLADQRRAVQDLFAALNDAYEVLSDDARRAEYLGAAGVLPDAGGAAVDFQKGEACLRTHDLRRARGFFEAAVRGDPRPEHLAALAWALLQEPGPDLERARLLAAQALRDPRCARAALAAGAVARADGHDAAAERHLRAALALEPGNADAQRELRALQAKQARRDRPRD